MHNRDTSPELEAYYVAVAALDYSTTQPGSAEFAALEDAIIAAADALSAARKGA